MNSDQLKELTQKTEWGVDNMVVINFRKIREQIRELMMEEPTK